MTNGNNQMTGASAFVAVAIVILLGAVLVVSILKYPTVDDALKYAASLSALVGVITGAFVSYFFTRGAAQSARQAVEAAERATQAVQKTSLENTKAVRELIDSASQAMTSLTRSTTESAVRVAESAAKSAAAAAQVAAAVTANQEQTISVKNDEEKETR